VISLVSGTLKAVFSLIPAISATLHPSDVIAVSNQPNVAYISLDRQLGGLLDYSAGALNAPPSLDLRARWNWDRRRSD